jgi:DNA (cytosine-5)-methyltransferase 1
LIILDTLAQSFEPTLTRTTMLNGSRKLTCVDLFAGCGGLSLGLERAGFEPLAFCELNQDAAASYLANRTDKDIAAYGDVGKLNSRELSSLLTRWHGEGIERIDLVCGGPPCQGYSGIGHRRSYQVDRENIPSNHLYKEMIRIIRAVKPRAFLFENVKGLMVGRWTADGEKGEIWREVRSAFGELEDLGYDVRDALVQSKDYGVPQNRPRVLIVGVDKSIGVRLHHKHVAGGLLPEPRPGEFPHLEELLDDLDDPDYLEAGETTSYRTDPQHPVQVEFRTKPDGELMGAGHPLTEQYYSRHSAAIREKFEAMHENGGVIPERFRTKKFAQRLLPRRWDIGPNITATSLPDDFVHYNRPRTLTVREWARLQTFPDWYQFRGPRTTGGTRRAGIPTNGVWERDVPRYTQIGNAVPVALAERVGRHLAEILR